MSWSEPSLAGHWFSSTYRMSTPACRCASATRACATVWGRSSGRSTLLRRPDSQWPAGPPGGAIFAPGGKGFALCPSIERRRTPQWKLVIKRRGSIYAGTDLAAWVHERGVDTVTLVGFMVNNCVLASAAWGETIGLTTEVLSDAVGATNLCNRAGKADARTVHTTLMALLHSNWAAVTTTDDWCRALARDEPLPRCNLVASAMAPF